MFFFSSNKHVWYAIVTIWLLARCFSNIAIGLEFGCRNDYLNDYLFLGKLRALWRAAELVVTSLRVRSGLALVDLVARVGAS